MRKHTFWKKIYICLLSAVSLIFTACTKVVKTTYPNGKTESEIEYRGGKMHGKAVWYYEHGKIRMQAQYEKGMLEGESIRYFRNGKADVRCTYRHDTLDGDYFQYDEAGWLSEKMTYAMGVPDGPYLCYHDGEQKKIEGAYRNGLFEGDWTYYDADGFVVARAHFSNGSGELEAYDGLNRVIRRASYEHNMKKHDTILQIE